jgi:beta-glucosidase
LTSLKVERTVAGVSVALSISNVGERAGAEVVQVYVGQVSCSVERPLRELKGFAKVHLEASESRRISLHLPERAFAYWSVQTGVWRVEPGEFVIEVGVSSRHIKLREVIAL